MSSYCPTSTLTGLSSLALLFLLQACSAERQATPSSTGSGGSQGTGIAAPTLRFDVEAPEATQALYPEEIKEFEVIASPPGVYRVRFSIVPVEQMPPHDASLDRTDADTDEDGVARVTLRAPSIVTVFNLQASVGTTSSTSITIGVQLKGEAELQVIPEYDGTRPISEWVANAYMSTLCSELPQKVMVDRGLPADSMFNARSVFGIPPRIKQLRVEPFMAVTLRAGHYAYGCTNVNQTLTNELNTVRVLVKDRPIALDAVDLDLSFGVEETTAAWTNHLQQAVDNVLSAFKGTTENDLALVLDTMQSLVEQDQTEDFALQRVANAWDLKALESLANPDGLLLRRKLAQWLGSGTQSLTSKEAITARLASPLTTESDPELRVLSVGGANASDAGFVPVPVTWTADPSDTVALGATLAWAPLRVVEALATHEATVEYPDASSLATAFGELLDCATLSEALTDDASLVSFMACDVDCTEVLCQKALTELAARLTQDDEAEQLKLSGTGAASVDEESRLVSFKGSWRGTFPSGESAVVGGSLTGSRAAAEP